jgi:hypothetical protein
MTVPYENPRTVYTSDGETLEYAIGFELIGLNTGATRGASTIRVFTEAPQTEDHPITGTVDGTEELVQGIDYEVDVDAGTITLAAAVTENYLISIIRQSEKTQEVDYQELTPFLLDGAIEYPFDKVTHICQEIHDGLLRMVKRRASDKHIGEYSYRRVGFSFPAVVTAELGFGEYTMTEVYLDGGVLTEKPSGIVVTAEEMSACEGIAEGTHFIVHAMVDTGGGTVYRFRGAACDVAVVPLPTTCTGLTGNFRIRNYTRTYFGDVKIYTGTTCNSPDTTYTNAEWDGTLEKKAAACEYGEVGTSGVTYRDADGINRWALEPGIVLEVGFWWRFNLQFLRGTNMPGLGLPYGRVNFLKLDGDTPAGTYTRTATGGDLGNFDTGGCYVMRETIQVEEY